MDGRNFTHSLFLANTVAALALWAAPALAADEPADVRREADGLRSAAGMPLYVFDNDTMIGMSHCFADCAKAWPPLIATRRAKASGNWSQVMREDGTLQWAYKLKPLYTCAKDARGKPATCADASGFQRAK